MEKENLSILELIPNPGFCVRGNRIIKTNLEAKKLPLSEGEKIAPYLYTGQEEYAAFTMPGPPVARMMSASFITVFVSSRDGTSIQPMMPSGAPA